MTAGLGSIVIGVIGLAWAADQFVIGAARVALIRNVSALVVGVVVVGFGTSTPELLVTAIAVADGDTAVGVGNIVGSNLANLTVLLGVGALLTPLVIESRTAKVEAPLALAATVAFGVAVQGRMHPWEGLVLLAAMAAALRVIFNRPPGSRGDTDPVGDDVDHLAEARDHRLRAEIVRTLLGLVATVGAAQLLLWGALRVADETGLAGGFVGVSLVAVGTSLPELVTVIQSARRRQADLIVGNLLGSNLFNALVVGGLVALMGAPAIDEPSLTVAAVAMAVVASAVAALAMATSHTITRLEGFGLVVFYCAAMPLLA